MKPDNTPIVSSENELIAQFIRKTILTNQNMYISILRPFMAAGEDMFRFLQDPVDMESAYRFATFINNVPDTTGDWHSTGKVMWNIYRKWLDDFIPAVTELSLEEANMLNNSRKFCEDNYEMYAKCREKYENIHIELLYLEMTPMNERPADYKIRLEKTTKAQDNALHDWEVIGRRTQFDYNYQIMSDLGRRAMGYSKKTLRDYFGEPVLSNLGPFYYTTLSPQGFLKADFEWEKFSVYRRDSKPFLMKHADAIREKWGLELEDATIHFEMIRVGIIRDWFVPDALGMRSWKWASSSSSNPGGDFPLSDGSMPPKGNMVLYGTELIFIRNITIKPNPEKGRNREILAKLAADWNGKSLKRTAFFPSDENDSSGKWTITEEGLTDNTAFLSAVMCRMLPRSPNPDWTLHWPVLDTIEVSEQKQSLTNY